MAELLEQAREWVGRPANKPSTARDAVNLPMIRRWCDVIGEESPVYTDPDYAARSVFGGIIAPIAMLDVWDKPGIIGEFNSAFTISQAIERFQLPYRRVR